MGLYKIPNSKKKYCHGCKWQYKENSTVCVNPNCPYSKNFTKEVTPAYSDDWKDSPLQHRVGFV